MKVYYNEKNSSWIDDVITQHRKQLEEFKRNRITVEDADAEEEEEFYQSDRSNKNLDVGVRIKPYKYKEKKSLAQNVKDEENSISQSLKSPHNLELNYNYHNYNNYDNNENKINLHNEYSNSNFEQSKTEIKFRKSKVSPEKKIKSEKSSNLVNFSSDSEGSYISGNLIQENPSLLKFKLDTKQKKLKQMKSEIDELLQENTNLKNKIIDLENYKQNVSSKVEAFDVEIKNSQAKHAEREREMINTIRQLEQEKSKAEEKLSKFLSLDNVKSQEIELMHQKIRDFELIIDENSKEHINSLKHLKAELEISKNKIYDNEKFFDILNYFFKKMQIHYGLYESRDNNNEIDEINFNKNLSDLKSFPNKLIELENFIIKTLNEKNLLHQKYNKILDIQSKITNNESIENSQMHLENLKKLNEKIFDLTEENKILNRKLEEYKCKNNNLSISHPTIRSKNITKSRMENEGNEEKENINIFTHNYIKEREKDTQIPFTKNVKKSLASAHKSIEERVYELEKELELRDRNKESHSYPFDIEENRDTNSLNKVKHRKSSTKRNSLNDMNESPSSYHRIISKTPSILYQENTSESEYNPKDNKNTKSKINSKNRNQHRKNSVEVVKSLKSKSKNYVHVLKSDVKKAPKKAKNSVKVLNKK